MMPLYSATIASFALQDEPLRALLVGIVLAICGLALAFKESLSSVTREWAALAATACAIAPLASAIGNVSIKRRGQRLDPIVLNGWAMLGGGALLLVTHPDRGLGHRDLDRHRDRLDRLPGRDRLGT